MRLRSVSRAVARTGSAWKFAGLVGGLVAACANSAVAPTPPPFQGAPPGPPSVFGGDSTPPFAARSAVEPAEARPEPSAPPPPPPAPKGPRIVIHVEPPYKLGERPVPQDRASYQADLLDRRQWNTGGLGPLEGAPPSEGHPMPRVIIDVTGLTGPHDRAEVERLLRRNHWIRVIGCYRKGAYKNQALRGDASVTFAITRRGVIEAATLRSSTLDDEVVSACLAGELPRLTMPRARGPSKVTARIHVAPGDVPMPPPQDELVPGDGAIDRAQIHRVVSLAVPQLEICYRRALLYRPELWGRLVLRFHVTDKGKLDEVFEEESRFPEAPTLHCVLDQARELSFPRPTGGDVRFVVPIRLWNERAPTAPPEE